MSSPPTRKLLSTENRSTPIHPSNAGSGKLIGSPNDVIGRQHNRLMVNDKQNRHSPNPIELHHAGRRLFRTPLSIETLKTADEIRGHRELWNWSGTRDSDLDYFLHFAGVQAEVLRPQVWVAYRGNIPEAMLISKLEKRQIPMRLGYLNFSSPRVRLLNIVCGGLRGSAAQDTTEALVEEVLKTLRCGEADVAVFDRLAADSQLCRTLHALPLRLERGFCWEQHNYYRLRLPGSSQALYAMLSTEQKRNYLRKGRKLVRDFSGDVSCKWYRQASPDVYRDLEFVAQRSYQRDLGVGFQDTPELRGWWELAGSKGWLRLCILYVGGKPCAFFTGVAYCGILSGDYTAYDRQFASYSPGMHLLLRGFGELCDCREKHGIQEIDFGPGDSELKSLLSSSITQQRTVYLYARTLQGVGLNLIFSFVFLAHRSAKKCLAQGRLLAWLRRLRRNYARRRRTPSSAGTS